MSSLASRGRLFITGAVIASIAVLVVLFYFIQVGANAARSYQTSEMLIEQVRGLIESNEENTQALTESLKEDYMTRAKLVAYVISKDPSLADDRFELMKLAELSAIDEINIFDDTGIIVGGTISRYYGYSFDSGDQMAFFKPMLDDKTLSMCQDVTPNTAEGKMMMYAICWNEAGTEMVQVGIEPVRLLAELHANEIPEVVEAMPSYEGTELIVADAETGIIQGASDTSMVGESLASVGLDLAGTNLDGWNRFEAQVVGTPSYCVARNYGGFTFVVAQDRAVVNAGVPATIGIVLVYLLLAAAVLTFIVRRMNLKLREEQKLALTEEMTGFLNRRAYEAALAKLGEEGAGEDVAIVTFDLNGLKGINDTLGHEMGDRFIRACAECIDRSFGRYGSVYRVGGDEFVAILHASKEDLADAECRLNEGIAHWSRQNNLELSVSVGMAEMRDNPGASVRQLVELSDSRMYESKKRYYESSGHDRRAQR
ncbi:MAG: diguanylate cyclase [Eggerthellaceae bacterium]|nr:diguanylate cyclase [Eggerthellaceae bacterium]